jgi:sugar-specific transcriptional regulator TrmB
MDQDERNIHNAIYDINQRMQGISNTISDLAIKHDRLLQRLESKIKELEIAFERFKFDVMQNCHQTSQAVGNNKTAIENLSKDTLNRFKDVESTYLPASSYISDYEVVIEKIEDVKRSVEKKQDFFNEVVQQLRNHVAKEVETLRKELTVEKPEVDPIKKEVDDIIAAFRLDVKGFNKELILLKKSKAYNDKKFENIYTLIERLKESK